MRPSRKDPLDLYLAGLKALDSRVLLNQINSVLITKQDLDQFLTDISGLTAPPSNRILYYSSSGLAIDWLRPGTTLAITTGVLDVASGLPATTIANGSVSDAEFQYLANVTSDVQTQINGKASTSHTHSASDTTSGTFHAARLGSGTADSTTFLRGDSTWATPAGGGAPTSSPYVTVASDATLSAERVLTGDNHLTITDNGANSTVVVSHRFNPFRRAVFWTEGCSAGDFGTLTSGTGAGTTANTADSDSTHPGTLSSSTGSTATGRNAACYIEASAIEFGTYAWRAWGCFKIPTLSDGTQTFSVMVGFNDSFTSTTYTDCACFRYQHSVNSGKFECLTRSNSVGSPTDSGVTAAANTWYTYEIRVNAAGTSVEFYLNGTLVQTHTTDIPTGSSRRVGFGHNIVKSLGTTARTLVTDFCLVEGDITR